MVAGLALLGVGGPLGAQAEEHHAALAPSDTCPVPTPRRWIKDTLFAGVRRLDKPEKLPDAYAGLLLEEIRRRWRPPTPLRMPAYGGSSGEAVVTPEGKAGVAGRLVHGDTVLSVGEGRGTFVLEVELRLGSDGSLRQLALVTSSTSPDLDGSVMHAIRAADSAHALPLPLGIKLRGGSLPLTLTLSCLTDSGAYTRAFVVTSAPIFGPLEDVWPLRDNPLPWYPQAARRAYIEGEVVLDFVIDENGHPVPFSYHLVRANKREFLRAVLDVLPRHRYRPARLAECPVPQLVRESFRFNLQ